MTLPPPEAGADPERSPRIRPYLQAPASAPAAEPAQDELAGLRPFVITAGRVAGVDPEICLETQVTARAAVPSSRLSPEMKAIVALCAEPVSVAEISARLRLHLGVTRILVGDLRATGHLDVHTQDAADPDNPETIMRVIRGLRAIS